MIYEIDNILVNGFDFPEAVITLGFQTDDPRCIGEDYLTDSAIILQGFMYDSDELILITQGFEANFGDVFPKRTVTFDSFIQVVHNFDSPIYLKDNIQTKSGVWI